jgi:2-desacetyl-2-hydroxyethyl bacteriochlorophyllide A dehydrogenase
VNAPTTGTGPGDGATSTTMRAVRCVDQAAVVVDVPVPNGRGGPGDADRNVRVKVASAGICGSDLHLIAMWPLPGTLGHEFAGTLADGTPVAVEPLMPCWQCAACLAGDYHRCVRSPTHVIGLGHDGGMAEWCAVPETAIVRLPAGLTPSDACLVEPVAVAVHGVRRGAVTAGERVAVIGGGTIGQCSLVAVQATGATVDLVARHDRQREAGERLGAGVLDAGDGSGSNDSSRAPYDVVFDAAGTSASVAQAVAMCAPGGRVVMVASYWEGLEIPAMDVCMKEITLVPASMYHRVGPSRDVDVAAHILASRPEIAPAIITHRFPLEAAAEAFRVAADRASGSIKVVLEP